MTGCLDTLAPKGLRSKRRSFTCIFQIVESLDIHLKQHKCNLCSS
jgi:hypothetical protein